MTFLRIAHLSDLHYSSPTWSPMQFFSKRWLGNANLLLSRKRTYIPDNLALLPPLFKKLNVDFITICGDISTTSLKSEFSLASDLIHSFTKEGLEVVTVPGNHDQYTKKAFKEQLFYNYFSPSLKNSLPGFNLKEHGVVAKKLKTGWWLVAIDTALATCLVSSQGLFSSKIEQNLESVLSNIPKQDSVIVINHFPFLQTASKRKRLLRGDVLEKLLSKYSNIECYLHGHTHKQSIVDRRIEGLPIILDSGSVADHKRGSWNLIEISKDKIDVYPYKLNKGWQKEKSISFKRALHS